MCECSSCTGTLARVGGRRPDLPGTGLRGTRSPRDASGPPGVAAVRAALRAGPRAQSRRKEGHKLRVLLGRRHVAVACATAG